MTYSDPDPRAARRTPEHPPGGGETDRFSELLDGMFGLTLAEGHVTSADFVTRTIEEAAKQGIELDDGQLGMVMRYGFGTPEQALERIADMTPEEFDAVYPGAVGQLLIDYVYPRIR